MFTYDIMAVATTYAFCLMQHMELHSGADRKTCTEAMKGTVITYGTVYIWQTWFKTRDSRRATQQYGGNHTDMEIHFKNVTKTF